MARALAVLALLLCAAGCGNGDGGGDMALCNPDTRTCAGESCGMACDPTRDTSCTDHGCFEPYVCNCVVDRWVCRAGVPLCSDMARAPRDLSSAD